MTPVDELEQTYRRIYRRLTLGRFVLYGVVVLLAVTVLVGNPSSKAASVGGSFILAALRRIDG
ncbi:hypothetical protein AB8B21_02580 [Tardiphaga sp. 866_E4_N2_1]|uniref:hypothetical protein n=1 Tax=unclassified Tardiphaga TaxID=2631404 RepID=UPI003F1E6FA0